MWEEQRKVSFAPVEFDVPAEHLGRCGRLELKHKVENTRDLVGTNSFQGSQQGSAQGMQGACTKSDVFWTKDNSRKRQGITGRQRNSTQEGN